MKTIWGLGAVSIALALSGCAGHRRASSENSNAAAVAPSAGAHESDEVAAALKTAADARGSYKLAPDDVVSVTVYQDRDINVRTHVDGDGSITLPLAGVVNVAGLTVAEAQKRIAGKLDRYFVSPTVNMTIEAYGTKQLYVLGEVQKPGPIPITVGSRVTLLQAITSAGGFTKAAAPKRAHVLRYENGRSQDYKVDLKGLIRSGDRQKDMPLEPNDVVYVPQALF